MEQETVERIRAALAGRYEVDREIGSGGMATSGEAGDLLCCVMPYVAGDTLADRLALIPPFNWEADLDASRLSPTR